MHQAEALCPKCAPLEIIKLKSIRTILNPEPIQIFFCNNCKTEMHEYEVIWSNYEWLYEEMEIGEKTKEACKIE